MKKYVINSGILVIGLFLGWLLFDGSSNEEATHNHSETSETAQMWTCSMHPQIMQPAPGDCPICGMDLIPAEVGADGLTPDQFKLTKNAMALANIQTTIVGKGMAVENNTKLSGKITKNEEANTVQVSYFSGRIERLNVNFTGEYIRKGQLLAIIYSPELYAAQQELITAASLKESQPALYQAVRNKLKIWKLSDSQINNIETSGKVSENIPVYATVSGTVTEKLVEQGDYVKQGQPLLKIANLNTVWANFDVYENQIDNFKKGQEVSINTNAYPNKTFRGKVDFIDPILNTKTRTLALRVVLNNKDDVFKPGMFVSAKIETIKNTAHELLTIPSSGVLWTGERSVVYVKPNTGQPIFQMREVTLGNRIADTYEVLQGLKAGDEIVTNGAFTVDAAAQLQGKKSMMNKEGGGTIMDHEGHLGMQSEKAEIKIDRIEVPKDFQNQLKNVYNSYIDLKNALVKEEPKNAINASKSLLKNLSNMDMNLLKGDAHNHWMDLKKEIKSFAMSISKSSSITEQRGYFKELSSKLIQAVQSFGVNEKVYVEYCPMADNNKGAYWLSKEEKVINPYFGSAMLTCGEVKQVID